MITDLQIQHELLKTALEATDSYLFVEKKATALGYATDTMVHDFTYEYSRAHNALRALGVLNQHEEYMQTHVQAMAKLARLSSINLASLPFTHVPASETGEIEEANVWDKPSPVKNSKPLSPGQKAKAKARARAAGRPYPNMVDNIWAARQEEVIVPFSVFISEQKEEQEISDEELQEMADNLTWEDIAEFYNDDELVDDDNQLTEKLSVQSRLRKKQSFSRTRGKRGAALKLKLRRASPISTLKKRAVLAARRALYKRFLKGRGKETLSAAEKDRVESQVASLKYLQSVLANKMLPKMRDIEQKRLASYRTKAKK